MRLTARSYGIALAIALTGIAGQWSRVVGESLWLVATAVFTLALAAEALGIRRQEVSLARRMPARAYLGVPFPARLEVRNPFAHALAMDVVEALPESMSTQNDETQLVVSPGASTQACLSLTPCALGSIQWSTLYTRTRGIFGLAWWYRVRELPASVEIAPRYMSRRQLRRGSAQMGRYAHPVPGSGSELFGLRDYVPGDPVRAIDWKATARRARPVVRLYERDEHLELYLAIDVGRMSGIQSGTLTRLHHYVNVAARLGQRALHQGDQVGLVLFADTPLLRLASIGGEQGLLRLRETLGRARTQARESNPLAAALELGRMAHLRSLMVLLTDVDEPAAAPQLLQAARLLAPKHQPLVAGILDDEVLDLRWHRALRWQDPYRSLAALELVREARRTAHRLHRTGAEVVLTRSENLDTELIDRYERLRQRQRV